MNKTFRRHVVGFTLIELMIAVAIVGILAAIAYPMYLDKVRESRRVDAKSLLLQAANRQEQYYTSQYKYATSMSQLALPTQTENKFYNVTTGLQNGDTQHFVVTAAAVGDQANDDCATLTVSDIGKKTANNKSGTSTTGTCW